MKYIPFLLFFICIEFQAFSQDTLNLLGGKRKAVSILEKNESTLIYTSLNGKKKKTIFLHNLYSIKYSDGKEVVVYKQDTALDFYFTPEEMKLYLEGFYDGKKTFKPLVSDISAGIIGAGGGVLLFPWGILLTGIGEGINIAINPKINWEKQGRAELKNNKFYQLGFTDGAQKKKLFRGLIIAGTTFAISATTTAIIRISQTE